MEYCTDTVIMNAVTKQYDIVIINL